jgi:uncharacterized protein YchJ
LESQPVTREAIINGLWTIGGVVVFVAVFVAIITRNLSKRAKNAYRVKKEGNKQPTKERNYREWKISGLNSRKNLYIKDKNLCPCGSGLLYKDCCGK